MAVTIECHDGMNRGKAVAAALAAARRGDLIVLPTEHVYALAVDAFSVAGARALRAAKGYDLSHPLPVMVPGSATVSGLAARVLPGATELMHACWPGSLSLLVDPQPTLAWDQPADAPLTVRMPIHPVALAVLGSVGPMIVTAAGLPGLDEPRTATAAVMQAGSAATVVLDAGELPEADNSRSRSTVVDARTNPLRIVRDGALSPADLEAACPGVVAPM